MEFNCRRKAMCVSTLRDALCPDLGRGRRWPSEPGAGSRPITGLGSPTARTARPRWERSSSALTATGSVAGSRWDGVLRIRSNNKRRSWHRYYTAINNTICYDALCPAVLHIVLRMPRINAPCPLTWAAAQCLRLSRNTSAVRVARLVIGHGCGRLGYLFDCLLSALPSVAAAPGLWPRPPTGWRPAATPPGCAFPLPPPHHLRRVLSRADSTLPSGRCDTTMDWM